MIHATFGAVEAQAGHGELITAAARCWRRARDSGEPVQPSLSRALAAFDRAMLTPVLDSLFLFYELALGRPIRPGATAPSPDELQLLSLMDGEGRLDCGGGRADVLACAICSARIMLAEPVAAPRARRRL